MMGIESVWIIRFTIIGGCAIYSELQVLFILVGSDTSCTMQAMANGHLASEMYIYIYMDDRQTRGHCLEMC